MSKRAIEGPDVSHWQGVIDWSVMATKVNFAIIRIADAITQEGGKIVLDRQWEANWQGAKDNGVKAGAYFYWRGMVNPSRQATAILGALEGKRLDLPVFVDVEKNGIEKTISATEAADRLNALLLMLDTQIGHNYVGIYSAQGYWSRYLYKYPSADLQGRPLWCAHWTLRNDPLVPIGWPTWHFWQYTNIVYAPPYGVSGSKTLDYNCYYGTQAQFDAQFQGQGVGTQPPPEPPPTSGDIDLVVTASPYLNVRSGPGVDFPVVGRLNTGDVVSGADIVSAWVRVGPGQYAAWVYNEQHLMEIAE